ncbi:hypothetical protein Tco_1023692 [Tanacetum coccineum]
MFAQFLIGRLNRGIAPLAIIDRQLPFECTISSRSTDVMVPIPPAPPVDSKYLRSGMWFMMLIMRLLVLCSEYEKGLPKKAATPQVMAIQGGRVQKANKKSLNAKGKGKGKGKGKDKSYIPKPKNPKPSAKKHSAKDDACHHCKEVGHCMRNCLAYLAELIKKKNHVIPCINPLHNYNLYQDARK